MSFTCAAALELSTPFERQRFEHSMPAVFEPIGLNGRAELAQRSPHPRWARSPHCCCVGRGELNDRAEKPHFLDAQGIAAR